MSSTLNQARPIGILANPISGAGKALRTAALFEAFLKSKGLNVIRRDSQRSYDEEFQAFLSQLAALVICGGDGTVAGLLDMLSKVTVPVYVAPCGVESLLSKYARMESDPAAFFSALQKGSTRRKRLLEVSGKLFFTMVSVGLDAEIVARIAATRQRSIGKCGYLIPILSELCSFQNHRLTIKVDGRIAVEDKPGFFIVANTPSYAGALNFVPEADKSSDTLFARFYPHSGSGWYLSWLRYYLSKRSFPSAGSQLFEGKVFEISASGKAHLQADGELCTALPATVRRSEKSILLLC